MSAEFDWRAAYLKEHADLCAVEGRNYVLEKALREIADWQTTPSAGSSPADIARKALGEETARPDLNSPHAGERYAAAEALGRDSEARLVLEQRLAIETNDTVRAALKAALRDLGEE